MSDELRTLPSKCLECSAELSLPYVCQECHSLYPLTQSTDYFAMFGLPRAYDVQPQELDRRFLSISRHVHPDFFADASEQMRSLATRLSAELNDAVRVLQNPVLRAGYLLEICGGPKASQDRTVPGDVLSETMMLRETIEQARSKDDQGKLGEIKATVEHKRRELIDRIASLARCLPELNEDGKTRLRHLINSMKYYDNMSELLWTSEELPRETEWTS